MTCLSAPMLTARLPSGHLAVYELQPQHLNPVPGAMLNDRALRYGRQIAHQHGGRWYKAGGWEEVDLRTAALLDRVPEIYATEA